MAPFYIIFTVRLITNKRPFTFSMKLKNGNLLSIICSLSLVTVLLFLIQDFSIDGLTRRAYSVNGSFSSPFNAIEPSHEWTRGADMLTPRTDFCAASLNEKIYTIDGFNNQGKSSFKVEYYYPKTNTWNTSSPLPLPLDHAAVATYNGSLYVVGGYRSSNVLATVPSDKLFIYNPLTDNWTEGKPLPKARGALTANFIDGTMYAVGGVDDSGVSNSNTAYDPVVNEWTAKKPMPTAREHLASAVVDGKLYVVGGRIGDLEHNLDTNEVYNPINDSWTRLDPIPSNRGGLAAASTTGGDMYVFGGEENAGTFNNNEKYDPESNEWIVESPMPTARHGLSAVTVDNKIYVIGGGPEPGLIVGGLNEIFQPQMD